jgi:hypothetical protein
MRRHSLLAGGSSARKLEASLSAFLLFAVGHHSPTSTESAADLDYIRRPSTRCYGPGDIERLRQLCKCEARHRPARTSHRIGIHSGPGVTTQWTIFLTRGGRARGRCNAVDASFSASVST